MNKIDSENKENNKSVENTKKGTDNKLYNIL